MMRPVNQSSGKSPVSKILLKSLTYNVIRISIVCLIISFKIPSIPADLLFFRLLTKFLISVSVKGWLRALVLRLLMTSANGGTTSLSILLSKFTARFAKCSLNTAIGTLMLSRFLSFRILQYYLGALSLRSRKSLITLFLLIALTFWISFLHALLLDLSSSACSLP